MKWLRRLMILLLLFTPAHTFAATETGAPPRPVVRAQLSAPQVRVGETLTLELAVLVPGWLSAPIDLPDSLELPGATVRLSEHSAPNINETVAGIAYAGVRRQYQIAAQRAGRFELPPIAFTVTFADGTRRVSQPLSSPALHFDAVLPKGLEGLGYVIVTPDFRFSQSLDRTPGHLQTGDALVRTLSQRAEGMSAVNLPVLGFAPVPGIATYPDAPQFDEQGGERNSPRIATQRQRVTYVLERPGDYELPGVELRWLDSRSGQVRTSRVPAVKVRVAAAPGMGTHKPAEHVSATTGVTVVSDTSPATSDWRRLAQRLWPWLAGIVFSVLWCRARPIHSGR